MEKKVLALNGSSRKGSTQQLLEQIAARLSAHQIHVDLVTLAGREIKDCIGCELCIRKTSQCYQKDDAQEILSQMQKADGLILASPVYVMNITGKLKSLIDKTASWVHRPTLVGKPALLVATTAGSGLRETLNYLEQVVIQWGTHPTGKIGRTVTDQRPVLDKEVQSFLWHLNRTPRHYKPSTRQLIMFQVQKVLALKVSALDREYWQERGWHQGYYFYPCRASWPQRWIAWITYQILDHRVKPIRSF
jgi:multimeric flavodoxin WrbA